LSAEQAGVPEVSIPSHGASASQLSPALTGGAFCRDLWIAPAIALTAATAAPIFREETEPMANIDDQTRRMLVQNAELSRQNIESSSRSRIDAIMDICTKPDIVWAVWPNGELVVKGHELVASGSAKASWVAIACADRAEAADLERRLA
jgi:hypothetical protein